MEHIAARGHVDAFIVSNDGTKSKVVDGSNTLLYTCADAAAHLFAGMPAYRPTTIAFVHGGSADLETFGYTQGDRTAKTASLIVGTGLGVHDIAIDPNKKFEAEDPDPRNGGTLTADRENPYTGNKVTLSAMTTDNESSEYIYGFLLKDSEGRVLAIKRLTTPVLRESGYAMAVSWSIMFS